MPNSSDYVCYESERAVESLSDCYKENIGSIEEYYEVFEEDGNQLKLSMVKDEIEIKEEIKRNRPNSMRQYFKCKLWIYLEFCGISLTCLLL